MNFRATTVLTVILGFAFAVPEGPAQEMVRIGVWNIEKLSETSSRGFPELRGAEGFGPRIAAQLNDMAEYIRDELQVDGLMVSEVEADAPESTEMVPQSAQLNPVC